MALVSDVTMSLINQMLQDLEKRRPHGAVGDVLPAPVIVVTHHRSLYRAMRAPLLIMALLGIAASAFVLLPRPEAAAINVASLPHTKSVTSNRPLPVQPLSTEAVQSDKTPPLLSLAPHNLILETGIEPSYATAMPAATPDQNYSVVTPLAQVTPQPRLSAVISVSTTTPETVIPVKQPQPEISSPEKKQQPLAKALRSRLSDNPVLDNPHTATDTTISSKHLKEITPAQQAENEYRKALELLQQRSMTRAIESLAQALQLDGNHIAARQTIINLLVEAQRFDEAEHRLQEGLHLDPGQTGLAMILARLQVERGDTKAGLETLQRSLPDAMARADYVTEQADYQAFIAALLQREGRHGEAIEHYLQALSKTPQSGIWLVGIGISLQAENRLPEAQEAFNRAKASNNLRPDLQPFVEQRLKQIKQQS